MATLDDKENFAPFTSSDALQRKSSSSPVKRANRKGRSKSIGPGGLDDNVDGPIRDLKDTKNRRKSTYVPTTKSIISADGEKAERQAARRRTLANRRVSFAPEATLHTWDVIEFMRDPTTSTDNTDHTRLTSNDTRSASSDTDTVASRLRQAIGQDDALLLSPAQDVDASRHKRRRSSGIPPMNFNNPDDAYSSSGVSGSSDASGSEDEGDIGSDDATGTAMSLDVDDAGTQQSVVESENSTGSSARLEASLKMAAQAAGTRGIDYDEHGDGDGSLELAEEEITKSFKPWVEHAAPDPHGSASMDQENVNPFSPAFKAQMVSGLVTRPSTIEEEDTGDMSMDVTRAVGGIMESPGPETRSSPFGEGTMDMTQAIGKIHAKGQPQSPKSRNGQKRRRSTTEAGSPSISMPTAQSKRRRSSTSRSSIGDETMDLTMAIGGIQSSVSPGNVEWKRNGVRRRSSGMASDQSDRTMDFTQAVGTIKAADHTHQTSLSFDENEELTMELTSVLGDIKAAEKAQSAAGPVTPPTSQSPARAAVNTTPKDQERFKDAPDSGHGKLLTPIFQKQARQSTEKKAASIKKRPSISPSKLLAGELASANIASNALQDYEEDASATAASVVANIVSYPDLLDGKPATPTELVSIESPLRSLGNTTPNSGLKELLDAQLQDGQPSPTAAKLQRSSPAKIAVTPEKAGSRQDARSLVDSIKLMNTPRKETLKNITPKKQSRARQTSPPKTASSKAQRPPSGLTSIPSSPSREVGEGPIEPQATGKPVDKIHLQAFLEMTGIRFLDLTTTKRRLTTAPTPSKAAKAGAGLNGVGPEIDLETAVVAVACLNPELEMYRHACHELKRYINDGKKVTKQLESETYEETPPLIQAYQTASSARKATLDTQMREMKTHARLRSKQQWYGWRSALLKDLMKALSSVGEGLLQDDEVLRQSEQLLEQVLPSLIERHDSLIEDAERLEQDAAVVLEEDREELEQTRKRLIKIDAELDERRQILEELQRGMQEQQKIATDLQESKNEFAGAIQEADRMRDACRGVSWSQVTALKESVQNLEDTYGWSITSASASPPTVTMTYKSHLQLFFHPASFQTSTSSPIARPNAPVSLTYIANDGADPKHKTFTTSFRFFLQLLRASLQALPQCSTSVADLLALVSSGWDIALSVAEAERRLGIEGFTSSRIVSDERLAVESLILLPKLRTKVRVAFDLHVAVEGEAMQVGMAVETCAEVVYGQQYGEAKMNKVINEKVAGKLERWDEAVRDLREQLLSFGSKDEKRHKTV